MSKKVIVLFHNDGQLANQLWLFFNLVAYSLENKFDIDIWCFYQYSKFFNTPFPKNKLIKLLFYKTFPNFTFKNKNLFRICRKLYRLAYKLLVILPTKILNPNRVVDSTTKIIYLDGDNKPETIKTFERDTSFGTIYTLGWNFLTFPLLRKYREQILEYFKPKDVFLNKIENDISRLRDNFDYLIGLHLRFKEPGDGEIDDKNFFWYVNNENLEYIKELLNIFFKIKSLDKSKTVVFIASNAKFLDIDKFKGLNVFYDKRHFIEDLYFLAECDVILGCKSSFGALASYIGSKPIYFLNKDTNKFLAEIEKYSSIKLWREFEI